MLVEATAISQRPPRTHPGENERRNRSLLGGSKVSIFDRQSQPHMEGEPSAIVYIRVESYRIVAASRKRDSDFEKVKEKTVSYCFPRLAYSQPRLLGRQTSRNIPLGLEGSSSAQFPCALCPQKIHVEYSLIWCNAQYPKHHARRNVSRCRILSAGTLKGITSLKSFKGSQSTCSVGSDYGWLLP